MKIKFAKEQLTEMYENNMSLQDIATKLECSEGYIWKHFNFYGIKRRNRSFAMSLKTKTLEHRQKLADIRFKNKIATGVNNPRYVDGKSRLLNDRNRPGLVYWRNSVKRRDGYKCVMCGVNGLEECKCCGNKPELHVHHIKNWKDNPDLRFDVNNGVTICAKCHRGLDRITGLIAGNSLKDNQQPS